MKLRFRKDKKTTTQHPDFPPMSETGYLEVLAALERQPSVKRYLEIGSRSGTSIARVNCSYIAVDPEFAIKADVFNAAPQMMFFQQTSDDFFASDVMGAMNWVPDLAFIDGMHLFEYALRDFINAERAMTKDGVICLHDVCPFDYEMTTRDVGALDRLTAWTGDVWKVVMALLDLRPDLQLDVIAARKTGLACVRNLDPGSTVLTDSYDKLMATYRDMELEEIGADGFFGRFDLVAPETFIRSL